MVAWRYYDVSLGVFLLDAPADVGNARRSVTAAGFEKYVLYGNLRKLLMHYSCILAVGYYPHVLWVTNTLETVVGELHE